MPTVTPDTLRTQIAKGSLAPIYALIGRDEAAKAALIATLVDTVEPELRAFNVDRLYGSDPGVKIGTVMDAARTLPWMAPRRVVVVMQAEKLLISRSDEEASGGLEDLERYLAEPVPSTVLVFVAADLDKRLNLTKVVYRTATVVDCCGMAEIGEVEAWVKSRAAQAGIAFDPAAIRAFLVRTGGEVSRVRTDLDRLLLFASASGRVTAADVGEIIGGAGVTDIWALNRALERSATGEALRELALLLDEGAVPYMVLGQIRSYVERSMPASKLATATEALMRTDLAMKTSGGDPRVLLERLVVELSGSPAR
ncbi:MAG: DNA polymerase III subunit delta [Acidobacteria bacterium]|nr:DNA polymerase III subunit delta [Acidobacteriota bacterium]